MLSAVISASGCHEWFLLAINAAVLTDQDTRRLRGRECAGLHSRIHEPPNSLELQAWYEWVVRSGHDVFRTEPAHQQPQVLGVQDQGVDPHPCEEFIEGRVQSGCRSTSGLA